MSRQQFLSKFSHSEINDLVFSNTNNNHPYIEELRNFVKKKNSTLIDSSLIDEYIYSHEIMNIDSEDELPSLNEPYFEEKLFNQSLSSIIPNIDNFLNAFIIILKKADVFFVVYKQHPRFLLSTFHFNKEGVHHIRDCVRPIISNEEIKFYKLESTKKILLFTENSSIQINFDKVFIPSSIQIRNNSYINLEDANNMLYDKDDVVVKGEKGAIIIHDSKSGISRLFFKIMM